MNQFEELRINCTLDPQAERERQAIIRENILNSLESIAPQKNLDEAIHTFVQQKLENLQKYTIVNSMDTILRGNSEDDVFFLFDQNSKMQYVIKAFHNIDKSISSFFAEISGNTLIHQMGIPSLTAPELLAISKYSNNGSTDGFLLEKVAKGTRLDIIVTSIDSITDDPESRKKNLDKLEKTFSKVGEIFAKLHHTDETRQQSIPDKWPSKMVIDLQKLETNRLSNKFKTIIDLEKLKSFINKIIQDAKNITFAPTYQFGSAHLKNIFYDDESDVITLIDTGKLHNSVDYERQPLSDPVYDLIRIREFLARISLSILSTDEMDLLVKALLKGYETIKPLPNEKLLQAYTVFLFFHKAIKFSDFDTLQNPEEMENHHHIFHEYVRILNKMI